MQKLRFAVSVAGLVTIASGPARAQGSDSLSATQRTSLALARLRVGDQVRIRTSGAGFVEGWIGTSPEVLTFRTAEGATIDVPASGADTVWVHGGSHAGTGALIGGALVGVGLGFFADAVAHSRGDFGCEPRCGVGPLVLGAFTGGAGGALIGAAIGASFPRWQVRTGGALAGLRVGRRARIRSGDGGFVAGWISNSPTLVTLRTADGSMIKVAAPGVDSLWVRGTHAAKGALIGGAVAGIGLAVFLASHVNRDNPYNARNTAAGALGLVGGGAFGAIVGAMIGGGSPKWELRIP